MATVASSEQDSKENSQGNSKNKEELEEEKPKEVKIEDIQSKNITEIIKKLEAVKLFLRNVYDPISVWCLNIVINEFDTTQALFSYWRVGSCQHQADAVTSRIIKVHYKAFFLY